MMIRPLLLAFALCAALGLTAQTAHFQITETGDAPVATLDLEQLRATLYQSPKLEAGVKSNVRISVPLPDGSFADYTTYNAALLPDHPQLGSFKVSGPWGGGRIAISPSHMSGVLRGPDGYFIIEQTAEGSGRYRIQGYADFMEIVGLAQGELACGYDDAAMPEYSDLEISEALWERGAAAGANEVEKAGNEARELRVYDLIMTCTGEFARKIGGANVTKDEVLASFNEAASTVNGIFENELGIRMNLVEVPGLIYLDPATDPYVNANNGGELLGQIIGAFTANEVSLAAYDLGHLFTARCEDVGGVVSGRACTDRGKTRGVTCVGNTVVGAALRIMAHEIAHQFAVSHSWNNCPGNEGQRAGQTAFEPGAGTTIMSYAGACGTNNIGAEQAYYHVGSLEQFLRYTREGGAEECATIVETSNFTPEVEVEYEDGFTIPANTPFRLVGTATDANNDRLTFNWEQYDLGPASDIRDPQGNAPLMRSVRPTEDGNVRYFPTLNRIVNNITSLQETLPTYTRSMTFRLTARDNNAEAGGVDWEQVSFRADSTAGPFTVNNPDSMVWRVGDRQRVTWDVANTDVAPVNSKRVNIVLSLDDGLTFDVMLAENAPNTGVAFVTVPEEALTTDARIMVEAADNVFLNVNRDNFRVQPAEVAAFTLESSLRYDEVCLPATVQVDLSSGSILNFAAPIALSVDPVGLPEGLVADFDNAVLTPGDNARLSIDLSDVRYSGLLNIVVVAVAEGQDTARRSILLDVTDNDYSDLATVSPAEGTTGIILSTEFDWTNAANADTYDFQLATSPTFAEGTIFEQAEGLSLTSYTPQDFFESNAIYYWRVRPTNGCGTGAWTTTNSFKTINSACESYESTDTPIGLPGNGRAFVRESLLFIEESGTISDVNIPNANVRYNFASKVTITLVSPAGTEVILYKEKCFSSNLVDLGFDDEAPSAVSCPANDSRVFIPEESLAAFNGENTFGQWILRVGVSETGGTAGSIQSWDIEFCADVASTPPQAISNTATECPPNGTSVILQERLEVTSSAFGSDGIIYTITELPTSGDMTLYGRTLMVGDTFMQDDINGRGLFYVNTDPTAENDELRFVVTTIDGGYLPVTAHDISIFEGAVVSTSGVSELDAGLTVFPNPTAGQVAIRWTRSVNRDLDVQLFDLNGRLLQSRTVSGATKAASVNLAALPRGVYLLRVDGAVRRVVKQ